MTDLIEIFKDLNFSSMIWQILTPLLFMLFDVITGIIQAKINNSLDSQKMRSGLLHKLLLIIAILMSFIIQYAFTLYIAPVICIYIVLMELISVLENMKKAGVDLGRIGDMLKDKPDSTTNESINKLINTIDKELGDDKHE